MAFPVPPPLSQQDPPPLNQQNVSRLYKIFTRGCYQSLTENHILIILNESQFAAALALHHVSAEEFRTKKDDPYELVSPSTVPFACYHGRHRIEAGKRYLQGGDRWWDADVLVSDGR